MTAFDAFIAIDWSGARKPAGIAVARCRVSDAEPEILPPPGGARVWSRRAVLALLRGLAEGASGRYLVGIDCAFSLPFDPSTAVIWAGLADGPALWARVDAVAARPGDDLYGGTFAADPRFESAFWTHGRLADGRLADGSRLARRVTERACAQQGRGRPESPLKLIGAKQVGKGGLAGMRVLHHLRSEGEAAVSIWPFDDDGKEEQARMVVAEIYPRLMLQWAGHGRAKIRNSADLAACLTAFGCDVSRSVCATDRQLSSEAADLSDHETDALVAAAGLRHFCRRADPLRIDRAADGADAVMRREGWIFGVETSPAALSAASEI